MAAPDLKPSFVYVTYIAAPAEKVWRALTDGDFTRQYFFGRRMKSDWKVGAAWALLMEDGRVDSAGKVLECEPPRRLAISWRVEWLEEYRKLPEAIVTFDIESVGEVVRLTMTQLSAPIDEKYLEGGRQGWPVILSGLKSLLETGNPLKMPVPQPPKARE
jgi:uncharacterized protein YndB with AHSA1/START domain